jgi:hypothetical protein
VTRIVNSALPADDRPVDPDRYGDRSALGRMASGPHLPGPRLPPTAQEADPAPADPGPCPTCGQPRSNLVNTFATGSRGGVPVAAREVDDPPEVTEYANGLPVANSPEGLMS